MKLIEKIEPVEKTFNIEVTTTELAAIYSILGVISGSSIGTIRDITDKIYYDIENQFDLDVSYSLKPLNENMITASEDFINSPNFKRLKVDLNKG